MNQNTVTGDYININLRQLGATSIKEFNSIMHIAEFDQLVPNSNSRMRPVATPMAKLIPNRRIQNFAVRFQKGSPVR